MTNKENRVIAFAGICQACRLAHQIAHSGEQDQDAFETILNSLLITDSEQPVDVYGGLSNLKMGLNEVAQQLGNSAEKEVEIARYVLGLVTLQKRLFKHPSVLEKLASRIEQMKRQVEHFSLLDETVINNFASIYVDLISPLSARIQVIGSPEIIKQPMQQSKIRAVLLAGLRSAVLWRQLGGSRRQVFFGRSSMQNQAKSLYNQI